MRIKQYIYIYIQFEGIGANTALVDFIRYYIDIINTNIPNTSHNIHKIQNIKKKLKQKEKFVKDMEHDLLRVHIKVLIIIKMGYNNSYKIQAIQRQNERNNQRDNSKAQLPKQEHKIKTS